MHNKLVEWHKLPEIIKGEFSPEREEIMSIPGDPIILLSYTNTQLRDQFATLEEFCKTNDIDEETLCKSLGSLDYHYDEVTNQFI